MAASFRFLLPLGLVGLFAGCCANNVCDCQDERADAFYFNFVAGSANGFAPAELDTVLVKRFALPLDAAGRPNLASLTPRNKNIQSFTDLADSLNAAGTYDLATIVRATALRRDTIVINNNAPFAQSAARKLNTYMYRIEVRSAPFGPQQYLKTNSLRYELKNIALVGEFYGTGCCTCYRNTSKTATLVKLPPKGQIPPAPTVITATETNQRPVYTPITK